MKKMLLLYAMLFCIAPVFAQSDDGEDDFIVPQGKSNVFFIGPKVGLTMTSMTQPNECDLYDGSGMGFSGGLAMKMRFGKASENSVGGTGQFGIGLELKYKQNKVKTIGTDEDWNADADLCVNYFEVPVCAQLYPMAKSQSMNSLYVELGAAFLGSLSATPDYLNVNAANISYKTGDLSGFDVRPFVGLGYTFPNTQLDINARYYIGTSEMAGNFPCKMSCAEVSLAWMFKAGKF